MNNTTARNYQIEIRRPGAATGFDVTPYCTGESGGYLTISVNPADESGLIRVNGTLVLDVPLGDTRFSSWVTPEQWAVGNWIFIQVGDTSGTLRELQISRLYIAKTPAPPSPGRKSISVELVDKFQLLSKQFPRRSSGIGLVSESSRNNNKITGSRTAVINRLLEGTGLELTQQLPNTLVDYEINYDSPIMAQVGELAIGGVARLWLNKNDQIFSVPISHIAEYRLFEHRVGLDDAADFEPLESPILPSTTVEVISPESAVPESESDSADDDSADSSDPRNNPDYDEAENDDRNKYSGSRTTIEYLSRSSIDEDSDDASSIDAIIRRESWTWIDNVYEMRIDEVRRIGLVVPKALYELRAKIYPGRTDGNPFTKIDALSVVLRSIYEGTEEGRLLKTTKRTSKLNGGIWGDYFKQVMRPSRQPSPDFTNMIDAEYEETTYSYQTGNGKDSKGQVRSIETNRFKTRGEIAGASTQWADPNYLGSPGGLRLSEVIRQSWRKRSADEWEHKNAHFQAGRSRSGTVKSFLALRQIKGETIVARNGDLQPPAADRRPASPVSRAVGRASLLRRGSVRFQTDGDTERKRTVIVKHLAGRAEARALATALGRTDQLRRYGFRITTDLRDEWFSWWPNCRVDLLWDGYRYLGCSDAVTYSFGATQAVVVADFMRAAKAVDSSPYPYPPLPPLLPGDPDPAPISVEPINGQQFTPTVAEFGEFTARSESNFVFTTYRPSTTTVEFTVQAESRFILGVPLVARAESNIILQVIPQLLARFESNFVLGEAPEAPYAHWPLDTADWLDIVDNRNLIAEGQWYGDVGLGDPRIGSAGGVDYTEFAYEFVDAFAQTQVSANYLRRYGSDDWTRAEFGYWDFRVTFEVWFENVVPPFNSNSISGNLFEIEDECYIDFEFFENNNEVQRIVRFRVPSEGGETQPLVSSVYVTSTAAAQTWLLIDVRCKFSTLTYSTFCNGAPGDSGTFDFTFGSPIWFGNRDPILGGQDYSDPGYAYRIRDVKFYRSNFTTRP